MTQPKWWHGKHPHGYSIPFAPLFPKGYLGVDLGDSNIWPNKSERIEWGKLLEAIPDLSFAILRVGGSGGASAFHETKSHVREYGLTTIASFPRTNPHSKGKLILGLYIAEVPVSEKACAKLSEDAFAAKIKENAEFTVDSFKKAMSRPVLKGRPVDFIGLNVEPKGALRGWNGSEKRKIVRRTAEYYLAVLELMEAKLGRVPFIYTGTGVLGLRLGLRTLWKIDKGVFGKAVAVRKTRQPGGAVVVVQLKKRSLLHDLTRYPLWLAGYGPPPVIGLPYNVHRIKRHIGWGGGNRGRRFTSNSGYLAHWIRAHWPVAIWQYAAKGSWGGFAVLHPKDFGQYNPRLDLNFVHPGDVPHLFNPAKRPSLSSKQIIKEYGLAKKSRPNPTPPDPGPVPPSERGIAAPFPKDVEDQRKEVLWYFDQVLTKADYLGKLPDRIKKATAKRKDLEKKVKAAEGSKKLEKKLKKAKRREARWKRYLKAAKKDIKDGRDRWDGYRPEKG